MNYLNAAMVVSTVTALVGICGMAVCLGILIVSVVAK
jgi:hypothetical protein